MCYNIFLKEKCRRVRLSELMVRVQLLGGFQVERDGVALTAFHSQKAQSLLAYLLVYRDRTHPRAVLANLFWGESDETRAQANLRNALYSLRQMLEGPQRRFGTFLITEGGAVRFNPHSHYSLDVQEFEEKLEAAQETPGPQHAALLEEAVGLYHGDLLPGFYDDWVLIEQEHLRELYLHALKELAAHYTEQKDYAHALEWVRRALAVSPWQEDLHRAAMQLYAFIGDRAAALSQYAECTNILQRELNAAPLPETQMLYERILHNRPLGGGAHTPRLPTRAPFVGREHELHTLTNLWHQAQQGHGQAVFIGGEVGVGKTTLVQRFLEDLPRHPPPPLGEGSGERSSVLHGASSPAGGDLPYQPLLHAIRAGLKALSKEKLAQLPAVWRSELAQFVPELQEKFPDLTPNPRLPPAQGKARWFAALTGFFELLARERPVMLFLDDLHWADDATLEYLGHLVGAKHTLPLLVIGTYRTEEAGAGSRLRTWLDRLGPGRAYHALTLPRLSPAETGLWLQSWLQSTASQALPVLYHQTEGNPLFLTELARSLVQSGALAQDQAGCWKLVVEDVSAAHWPEDLRELIRASVRRVPARAQGLLGPAAVLGRSFELPVLREVLHQPTEKLLDRLDALCHAGLLVERDGRYQFHHELTRQVIYDDLSTDRKKLWHKKIGQALETIYPQAPDELAGDLARHFEQAALWKKAIRYAERAGTLAQDIYAHRAAIQFFTKAAAFSQTIKDHQGQAQNLNNIGRTHVSVGEYPDALRCYSQALQICQQNKDREGEGRSLNNIGVVHQEQGKYEEALHCYHQTLTICQELKIRRGEGISLNNIGNIYHLLGQYEEALAHYQQALEIRRELGERRGEGITLDNLGGLLQSLGRYSEALSFHEQALKLRQELGDRTGAADTLENLGMLFVSTGKLQEARASLEQALEIRHQIEERRGQGYCFYMLGHCCRDQGDSHGALKHYQAARALFGELGLKAEYMLTRSAEGRAHLKLKALPQALSCSTEAVKLLEGGQGCATPHEILFNHFQVLAAHGQEDKARTYLQRAYQTVMERAEKIRERQEDFLTNVPINCQIIQAWEATQRDAGPG
ncbi:Response regulator aspartate phosphatase G [bacterium HR07]|uniref:Transcriptional activator domain-containing protein n=1 Tax=Acetithermum autotrophicum TaxID=1446466 RepID=H5SSN8_ACEAU|nr:transcriptional activator domain-containing protein [Candidatus Acetothermum autotrophicum]GBC76107.1 Response regulator aspartate phosphatase G [bacterium HR07]